LLLDDTFGTLGSVAQEMSVNHGVNASKYTISRSVKAYCKRNDRPIEASNSKPKKQLTPKTMKSRFDFCLANKRTCWGHVMFTDRCKFQHTYVGGVVKKSVWRRVGEGRFAPKVNHASTFNVYAGITKHGVTHMHVVAGTTSHKSQFKTKKGEAAKNITSAEYKHVVSATFLPEGKRLFAGAGMSTWLLQQDNDPTHRRASHEALAEWNRANPSHKVGLLSGWPPHSPDLNPIENVWSYIQEEVNKAGCTNFQSFCETVKSTFANLPSKYITKLFESMRRRIDMCIDNNGGPTKY
jgi:hypothetical protein